jgi:hypothetical protein
MARQDSQAALYYVDEATADNVEVLIAQFEPAYLALNAKLGQRVKETEGKTSALADLQTCVRDFWEVGKRMVARRKLSTALLAYYGLAQDGSVPKSAADTNWLDFAAQIIKGEADAVAAGYPAMSNPSAADVAAQLTLARAEFHQVGGTDRAYDTAQETVATLRLQVDAMIQEIMAQLRFNLRKKDEASQRRIMRSYGAKFAYGANETPDDDGPTPDPKPVEPAVA